MMFGYHTPRRKMTRRDWIGTTAATIGMLAALWMASLLLTVNGAWPW